MRFAITAADRYLGVFEAFVSAGWTPLKLFTVPITSRIESTQAVAAYAEKLGLPVQWTRLLPEDLEALAREGCEALIVASYPWRVPDWTGLLPYAVNFHSSPLPEARGPYPLHRAILEAQPQWGVVCHKLAPQFDSGDILDRELFPLDAAENHESLCLKIQMAAVRLSTRIARDWPRLWRGAEPQGEGSYWPATSLGERIIRFDWSVERILRHVRAFGRAESFLSVGGRWLALSQALGWTEAHDHKPGRIVHITGTTMVLAARDGYIAFDAARFADPAIIPLLDTG